jgi:hypothetical protein
VSAGGGGAILQDLKVVVEAGHLEHFHHGQAHLGRQGHEVALEQAVETRR